MAFQREAQTNQRDRIKGIKRIKRIKGIKRIKAIKRLQGNQANKNKKVVKGIGNKIGKERLKQIKALIRTSVCVRYGRLKQIRTTQDRPQ